MAASIPDGRTQMAGHVLKRTISGDITEQPERVFAHGIVVAHSWPRSSREENFVLWMSKK